MTYEELKRRVRNEGLEQYCACDFDRWSGGYIALHVLKNQDGTVSYCFTNERGSPEAEHLNLPEDETCDDLYAFLLSQKTPDPGNG